MATKTNLLKTLPPYLIICFKQYRYTHYGMEKVNKCVGFGATLRFKKAWMSGSKWQSAYRLCATCNHHGQGRGGDGLICISPMTQCLCLGDHYTANVLQRNGCWTHFDDSTFTHTNLTDVLSETPYLLMYEQL